MGDPAPLQPREFSRRFDTFLAALLIGACVIIALVVLTVAQAPLSASSITYAAFLTVALLVAGGGTFATALAAAALLGLGTALVYPTLIAAVSDVVEPRDRASVVGVYRFWRDTGFVAGALLTGFVADTFGRGEAIATVAALTAASGLFVAATPWSGARPSRP